jgi:hypothetical protein
MRTTRANQRLRAAEAARQVADLPQVLGQGAVGMIQAVGATSHDELVNLGPPGPDPAHASPRTSGRMAISRT